MAFGTLFLTKLFVVALITVASAIGIWAPFMCVGRSARAVDRVGGSRSAIGSGRLLLSVANCFSAGMLLTMALVHFFPDALESDRNESQPMVLPSWMLVGILIPAVIERTAGGGGHGHSHGSSYTHQKEAKSDTMSTSTLLILLMCFHGMTEGFLLGFEKSTEALVSAALPLSIHKFFDGVVIGVSIAKEYQRALFPPEEESIDSDSGSATVVVMADRNFSLCSRSVWRTSVLGWLFLTPLTMLLVVLGINLVSAEPAVSKEGAALKQSLHWVSVVQAVGSGSFIYVGISIILQEELKGLKASLSLLIGVLFTFLLFAVSAHE